MVFTGEYGYHHMEKCAFFTQIKRIDTILQRPSSSNCYLIVGIVVLM